MCTLRELAVGLVAALLLVPVQAGATHEAQEPLLVLDGAESSGGGWATYRLEVPAGARLKAHLRTEGIDRMAQHGYRLIDEADGRVLLGSTGTTLRRDSGVAVDEGVAPGLHVEREVWNSAGLDGAMMMNVTTMSQSDRTVLLAIWSAGPSDRWLHQVSASAGVTLLATAKGESAHLLTSRDFEAEGRAEALAANVGVRTLRDGTLTLTVENVLFGEYGASGRLGQSEDTLRLTTPGGETLECPCEFPDARGPDARPPGEYKFHLDGLRAGWDEEAYVVAVDLRFPS